MPVSSGYRAVQVVICCLLLIHFVVGCQKSQPVSQPDSTPTQSASPKTYEFEMIVETNPDSDEGSETIKVQAPISRMTVFEVLKLAESKDLITTDYSQSQDGWQVFVKSINGVANDASAGRFWTYYVNDKLAKVGCREAFVDFDEKIHWKYRPSPF